MWIMAYLAGSPFFQLIDMNVMSIVEPVSETGLGIRQLVIGHFVIMTSEAEGKVVFIERHVKIIRKIFPQQTRIFSSMGGVAGITIAISNRFVNRLADKHSLVMTNDAQLRPFTFQHEFNVGLVGIMTPGTVAVCNGRV